MLQRVGVDEVAGGWIGCNVGRAVLGRADDDKVLVRQVAAHVDVVARMIGVRHGLAVARGGGVAADAIRVRDAPIVIDTPAVAAVVDERLDEASAGPQEAAVGEHNAVVRGERQVAETGMGAGLSLIHI